MKLIRRSTSLFLAAGVALVLVPSVGATRQTQKKETKPYTIATGNAVSTVTFTPPAGTAFVLVDINDQGASAAGMTTRGTACQDTNGNGMCGDAGEANREFCDKTSTGIAVIDTKDVFVFVNAADTCGSNQPALGTTGTVTVTYVITKAPKKAAVVPFAKVPRKTQTAMYAVPQDVEGTGFAVEGFTPPAGAGFVGVKITDDVGSALGRPTGGAVCQDSTGDNVCDATRDFCNQTSTPIAIQPGFEVAIFVEALSITGLTGCGDGELAIGTTGTITLTWYITGSKGPPKLKETAKKSVAWEAPVPCAEVGCPYVEFRDIATGDSPCTRSPQFSPQGSWDDVTVKVPLKVGGRTPQAIVIRIAPTVDWDLFACRMQRGDYVYAGRGEPPADCNIGCPEEARVSVVPGETLILRAWNFSDPNPMLQGQYAWLVAPK